MRYTFIELTLAPLLHRKTGTVPSPERPWQNTQYAALPLPVLGCLLSFTLSACAAQSLPTTLSAPNVQTAQRPHPQEPTQSAATNAVDYTVRTATAVFTRGQKALEAGRYENAVDLFGQAIQIDATNALYYLWLGRAYGHQAEQTNAGEQFFLARQVRKNLEKAVTLNPDLIEARLDLLTYYLQAPSLLGGGIEKAQAQAGEITKRDPDQGALAWQQCQQAEEKGASLLAVTH
jgi:tetratricopeptide (TPR) repeat protein